MTKPRRPSRGRALSDEDEELWAAVSKSIKPVRKRDRVHPAVDEPLEQRPGAARSEAPNPAATARRDPRPTPPVAAQAAKRAPPAPTVADLDRRRARKIAAGGVEIEARLDLHGMYQNEAHARLRAFILRCHGRGQRHVLVVTGKGIAADDQRPFELEGRRNRGVLRRNVPLWLAASELRAVVVSFTTAHARHGGEGALYIQLRSPHRNRERSE